MLGLPRRGGKFATMPELDLSITIITYNEERDLPRCLASLPRGAEVIVVDSHSSDRTLEIARNYGAKTSSSSFVNYGQQKNKALQQATKNWVFSLDADEEMSPALARWLQENFAKPAISPHLEGFKVVRQSVFMGRKLRFGRSCRAILSLFRREKAHFVGAVHEKIIIPHPQAVAKINHGVLLHYSYADHHDYWTKFNYYSDVFAQQSYRQRRQVALLHVLRPPVFFFYLYVLRGGFLDGYAGYCLAIYGSLYSFVKYAKLNDLYRQAASLPAEKPAQH